MLILGALLLLRNLPSILGIACFTDIACLMLPNGEFACNNTALVDCTESLACFTYYSAPDLTQSPSSWSSSTWSRRLRGCASDDVITSMFDTATGWSARCGFGGERLMTDHVMTNITNLTETATIPILAINDSLDLSTLINDTMASENVTFPITTLLITTQLHETSSSTPSEVNMTTPPDNTTVPLSTVDISTLLTNETMENSTTLPIVTNSTSITTTSTTLSTTTDPDATTETTESSTTSETESADTILTVTESSPRVRRDTMVPAGYAGCLCYSDGCNGPEDKYLVEIHKWLEQKANEATGKIQVVVGKSTDYEDTGAEPMSDSA